MEEWKPELLFVVYRGESSYSDTRFDAVKFSPGKSGVRKNKGGSVWKTDK